MLASPLFHVLFNIFFLHWFSTSVCLQAFAKETNSSSAIPKVPLGELAQNQHANEMTEKNDFPPITVPSNVSVPLNIKYSDSEAQSQDGPYWWLSDQRFVNLQPYAPPGYKAFRNVKDYGAIGDGITDDHAAIMKAMNELERCGEGCSTSSTLGAVLYFPPGKYFISQPIVQYYFTVMTGHPVEMATIVASSSFKGSAMVDADPYGSNGNWWKNQNNVYRQIRNLIFDMSVMPNYVPKAPDSTPIGIHWQVSQGSSLQNVHFRMPRSQLGRQVRHVGVYMENGSGGFMSDLTFDGGSTGLRVGNQQFTFRNLKFQSCDIAVEVSWNWGFTFKNINVQDCNFGIKAVKAGDEDPVTKRRQSAGSLIVQDSSFANVGTTVQLHNIPSYRPSLILDNVALSGTWSAVVADEDGTMYLNGTSRHISSWGIGTRYERELTASDSYKAGFMTAPNMDSSLFGTIGSSNARGVFERSKPQYPTTKTDTFINVLDFGAKNDASYPNTNAEAINYALQLSAFENKVLVFPAGVYKIDKQIYIPKGARLVGILWPQLMAVGERFGNTRSPQVFIKVGNPKDKGVVEISDLLITGSGATAGAIFMEWNVHESTKGSAAMWDSIIRVGGAFGTEIDEKNCHQDAGREHIPRCMAGSMMLRVTKTASIYMENNWFWVADHDMDSRNETRINTYSARGILIESQGPSWVYGTSSEHSTLYNWQLAGAKNIYMGHIQAETPYFQAGQMTSLLPYPPSDLFPYDPEFSDCGTYNGEAFDTCREAWALRIIKSSNVYLYGGALYSFFQNYTDTCTGTIDGICQDKLVDIDRSDSIWLYGLYTIGAKEVLSPQGLPPLIREGEINGLATSTSAWLVLSSTDSWKYGGTRVGPIQKKLGLR